jgi:hypothetical protein
MRVRYLFRGLAVALALAAASCGDGKVKVKGVVTLDGTPVEGAMVTFIPEAGGGRNAFGSTKPDGSFQLMTQKENDGVAPGNYKVTVTYTEPVKTAAAANMKDAWTAFKTAEKQKKPPAKYVIPAKYGDPNKTVLKQKVPPDGEVKFDLQSK